MTDPNTDPTADPKTEEPTAHTAGEQDHSDPDSVRGEDADAPADAGRPEDG